MENSNMAAIYCRLSKEDTDKIERGDDSESIQNQKLLLMDYAMQKEFNIYKVYVDDDYSGFSDRPSFKEMLRDAENRKFGIVLCKHQSRFTRDMELVEKYIHGYFIKWGIRFISLTDNVDTAVKGSKKSRQINGLINEWYCEDLSENVKSVIKAKREQGQYVGAFVCYGYKKDPKDKHKIIIDEEAAEVVKEIFAMYLSGMGVQSIALELTARGVPTPSQYKELHGENFKSPNQRLYSIKYGSWAINTVRRILRNEMYIGNMVQGRERSISYKTKKLVRVPKEEWAVVKDTHEPIIGKRDFYTVQSLIDHKRTEHFRQIKNPNTKAAILAGKVICLDCGSPLHRGGSSRDGKERYLRCNLAKKTRNSACTPHNVSEKSIEYLVEQRIKALIDGTLEKEARIIEIAQSVFSTAANINHTLEIKRRQLTEIEIRIVKTQENIKLTYEDKLNGLISAEEFVLFKNAFQEEKESFIKRKEQLEIEIEEFSQKISQHTSIIDLREKYKRIELLSHEIVNDFIDNIQVGERDSKTNEQAIIINWNF